MDIQKRMDDFHVPGLSVTKFGSEGIGETKCWGVLEQGATGEVGVNTMFHACSISKMVTAVCVLKLAEAGELDLDVNVQEYLSEWTIPGNTYAQPVTLRLLLSHQAGFLDEEGSFEPYAQGEKPVSELDLLRGQTRFHPGEAGVRCEPGTHFEYSDAGYCIIAEVLRQKLGIDVCAFAGEVIFRPLGLKNTFFWKWGEESSLPRSLENCAVDHDNTGQIVPQYRAIYPNPEGAGLWTSTEDLSVVVADLYNAYRGKPGILRPETAVEMFSPYICGWMGLGVFLEPEKKTFFSQGWGIGMQCKLRASLESGQGVVVMMNCEPGMDQDSSIIGEILRDIFEGR